MTNEIKESELEAKLVKAVEALGGLAPKWTSPANSGVPDRLLILPTGLTIYVEMKRPKGAKIGPKQQHWKKKLERRGHLHYYVFTEAQLSLLLADIRLMLEARAREYDDL